MLFIYFLLGRHIGFTKPRNSNQKPYTTANRDKQHISFDICKRRESNMDHNQTQTSLISSTNATNSKINQVGGMQSNNFILTGESSNLRNIQKSNQRSSNY